MDAIFFDANNDSHPDLYVVSGGNQPSESPLLEDRLYINDGKGHFAKVAGLLPVIPENKSCVAIADIDRDGDQDVFVGHLANPMAYGVPQTSSLLLNDGKSRFSIAKEQVINLKEIGMVTSAAFADMDKDGWPDLLIAGEFMPLTIFKNKKGIFEKSIVSNSTGWWQCLFIDDVNNDGNLDMLAGNWGWNNKFTHGKNGPVKLYVSDYDKNGRTDQLLSYTVNNNEFPFLAKDEVERALPTLKKHYLLYAEYAGVPMKEVFYGWIDNIQPIVAERLGSAIFYGDGKGGFTITDLPAALQLAPILSFQQVNKSKEENTYIAGGNFFDVIPYEGRYDAQPLALLGIDKNKNLRYTHQADLFSVKGQIRDLKWIRTKTNGKLLMVVRNNDSLLFYKQ